MEWQDAQTSVYTWYPLCSDALSNFPKRPLKVHLVSKKGGDFSAELDEFSTITENINTKKIFFNFLTLLFFLFFHHSLLQLNLASLLKLAR